MKKTYDCILKYKTYIIPIFAAILNFIPLRLFSEKLTLLLWTLIVAVVFGIIENYPRLEFKFRGDKSRSEQDIIINLTNTSAYDNRKEIFITIEPYNILKREYGKNLKITFPEDITIIGSSKREQCYSIDNNIIIPIKDIASIKGKHTYQFALALEKEYISGEDTEISCSCEHTLIKCVLNNKATIYWDRSEGN